MAAVTLARDRQLLRQVALKTLKPGAGSPTALAYFCREAQITAQLDHPNIVPLYAVKPPEHPGEAIAFVMKRVQGQTLAEMIRSAARLWRLANRHRALTVIVVLAMVLVSSLSVTWSLWKEQRTLQAGRVRERVLTALQAEVSHQAHAIDSHFLRLESLGWFYLERIDPAALFHVSS